MGLAGYVNGLLLMCAKRRKTRGRDSDPAIFMQLADTQVLRGPL